MFQKNNLKIINADCMDIMKDYEDNYFDLAIVDPPYGIGIAKWDKKIPNKKYFEQLFRVSKNQIIWGGNYFNLPHKKGWICWDKSFLDIVKKTNYVKNRIGEFELAWTNFLENSCFIRFMCYGNTYGFNGNVKVDYNYKGKIHPTQKHIKLYEKLLIKYAKKEYKILDTHLGSGSSAIASYYYDCKEFIGIEIDEDYYKASIKRIKEHTIQTKLF
jgi:site-specific DNA-methyltransferase (adenine-specific)